MGFTRAPEDRPTPPAIYNYRPYLLTFLSCLGSWMFGYSNGVIAGLLVLPSFYHDSHLPPVGSKAYDDLTSNIVSLFQIGGLTGSMLTFPIMKYWGRRVGLVVWGTVYFGGAALQVCICSLILLILLSLADIVEDVLRWKAADDVQRPTDRWSRDRRRHRRRSTGQ